MNTRTRLESGLLCLAATALLAGAACAGAREGSAAGGAEIRYRIDYLPSLGGSRTIARSINNRGWVTGRSMLEGDEREHAVLWRNGVAESLDTLDGPNSAVMWPDKNERGLITGITQTLEPDPNDETWSCGFFFPTATATGYRCVGFVWERGRMRELPTLGGTHGFATASNNRGQIVGWAETADTDDSCTGRQVLGFRAVLWGPHRDQMRQLPPLADHEASAATAINDRGQAVGISGDCANAFGGFSAISAVLWEGGEPIEIETFGGVAWNTPMAINHRGDVVGFANASAADGGGFNPRAFLWIRGQGTKSLGMLPGHASSQAAGINMRRQVVGTSCPAEGTCHAIVWLGGSIRDLNALSDPGEGIVLSAANDIDERGRIVGQATVTGTGVTRAFIATPYRVGR